VDEPKPAEIVDIDQRLIDELGPFQLVSWADGLPEPTKWQIRSILPEESCCIVGAEQKTGKTWLTLELALAKASGTDAFGEWPVEEAGKVLIYSPEGGFKAMKRRLYAMCWGRGLDPVDMGMQIKLLGDDIHVDNPRHRAQLKATIDEFQPHLLIMDPLISIHSGEKDESSSEIQPILAEIRSLIKHAPGMSVIVCHHFNKGGKSFNSALNQLRGSTAISAWLDSGIILTKESDENGAVRNVQVILRDEESPDKIGFTINRTILPQDEGDPDGLWSMKLETCEPYSTEGGQSGSSEAKYDASVLNDIENHLNDAEGGVSEYSIHKALKITKPRVSRMLKELLRQKRAKKGFDGKWRSDA